MKGRTASLLAWSTCALSLTLTALSFLLVGLLLYSDTAIYYYWLETSMVTVGYSIVGAIVASRLPASPIGWLFCAIALCFGVVHFSAEYAAYALVAPSRSLPAGEAFAWLTSWVWVGGLGLVGSWICGSPTAGCPVPAGDGSPGSPRSRSYRQRS